MTTTEQPTALAVREYTDKQLKTRMTLNQQAGYGLEKASPAQLNIVFLLCQRYQLDPVSDITLFEGRPFITIDGRLRLLRRHPEYRGYSCEPLTRDQKEAWGYDPADIVVACTIRTGAWGEITARGRVAATEVESAQKRSRESGKKAAPIGTHPVEIAEKRAISRAERAAFGQEAVLDEDEVEDAVQVVIEQRNDPVRNADLSAQHQRIFEAEYDSQDRGWTPQQGVESVRQDPEQTAPARQEQAADPVDQQRIGSKKDPVWQAWEAACSKAIAASLEVDVNAVQLGMTVGQIDSATKSLLAEVADAVDAAQALPL